MDEEKPSHPAAFQSQPEDEAVVQDASAWGVWEGTQEDEAVVQDASAWGVWEGTQEDEAVVQDASAWGVWEGTQEDAPMLEELTALEEDWQGALIGDADATANDEAMAHALYMEELMQFEEGQEELRHFEEPRLAPEGQQAAHQFGVGAAPHVFGGGAAHANASNNHHGWPTWQGESVTIHLEPTRTGAEAMASRKDAMISARQTALAGASSTPGPAVLAGMEQVEEAQDNGWYDSIVQEAQRIEAMEDPELYDIPFQQQQQLPISSSESPCEEDGLNLGRNNTSAPVAAAGEEEFSLQEFAKRWRLDPSELDPDEPGPSTRRRHARVPPLDKKDVPRFYCGICMKDVPVLNLFHGARCDHRFCVSCMVTYIDGRVGSGEERIPCPDPECNQEDADGGGLLHPEECKKSIDFAAFGSWGDRLAERAIPSHRRAYCPNRRCGVMLEATGGDAPALTSCPECSHPMCATCGLDWSIDESGDHDCTEGPETALVKKLAYEGRWKQCPECRMLVERTAGCRYMTCRCSFHFCYDCGLPVAQGRQREEGAGEEMCQYHKHN